MFLPWKGIFAVFLMSLGLAGRIPQPLHLLDSALEVTQFVLAWPHWIIFSANFWHCGLRWVLSILVGAGMGLFLIPAFFGVLALVGFTAGGVVAGSLAACCQARIGEVAAGSCFSVAQSMAANGVVASCSLPALLATSLMGAVAAVVGMYTMKCNFFQECCHDEWRWWNYAQHQ